MRVPLCFGLGTGRIKGVTTSPRHQVSLNVFGSAVSKRLSREIAKTPRVFDLTHSPGKTNRSRERARLLPSRDNQSVPTATLGLLKPAYQ